MAMKHALFAFLVLVTLTANKCAQPMPDSAALLEKKWVFQTIGGERLNLPDKAEAPWLKLSEDKLMGFGGCNALFGGYALSGDKLSFSDIGSTKKFCEGIQPTENAVKDVLGKVESFKLGDGVVKLMGGGNELAELRGE